MATQFIPLLPPHEEERLHFDRLLIVEERPFTKLKTKLLSNANLRRFPGQLPTPPADAVDEGRGTSEADQNAITEADAKRAQWRDELLLDFEAFEASLIRIQLLKDSNERERQRYAVEKNKILETAQAVRNNTTELRTQLVEAQRVLALRKEYDVLADRITSHSMLKPRDEQTSNLEKLNAEIAELEVEGREYKNLWADRRTRFDRIVDEGKVMMRIIRGEKDEEDKEEGEEEEDGDTSTPQGDSSRIGTPGPDRGDATPMSIHMESDEVGSSNQNELLRKAVGLGNATSARGASTAPSPAAHEGDEMVGVEGKDTEMGEAEAMAQGMSKADDESAGKTAAGEQMDTT